MFINKRKITVIATLSIGVMLLTSCTTIDPYTGETRTNDSSIGVGAGTAGGVVVGALIGGQEGALIGGALGAVTGGFIGHALDQENEELRRRLVGTGVQVRKEGKSIQLIMASDISFETNQSSIKSNFYKPLDSVALVLKKYANRPKSTEAAIRCHFKLTFHIHHLA